MHPLVPTGPLSKISPHVDFCFELSWEVCNKVGGIYTVVRSKVPSMMGHYGANYVVMGPYVQVKAAGEFVEDAPPDSWRPVFERLRSEGIVCHYGRWIVKGEPICVLIEFAGLSARKDEIKHQMWERYKIDSYGSQYFDYDEPLIWSVACGRVIEAIANLPEYKGKRLVAHCHEWLAAGAALWLRMHDAPVATVFTTHATVLGRALASSNVDLYNVLGSIDPDEEAHRRGVHTKFQTERAAAHNVDAFTTVSEITGIEAEALLGKKPDLILPNGLDMAAFPTYEELAIKHSLYKKKIREFMISYFFPRYTFDLDNTLFFFISGRYEYHDKGIDILLEALGRLNVKLKAQASPRTIVCFLWIPAGVHNIKPEIVQSKSYYEDILQTVDENFETIRAKVIANLIARRDATLREFFPDEMAIDLKAKVLKFLRSGGNPPLCTHDLYDETHDEIVQALHRLGLENSASDPVKIIFYPIYLNGADGLIDLSNYESMMGCHLGIFPSYYEPWGYTPLECSALGVASVTTDLAGFGRYVQKLEEENDYSRFSSTANGASPLSDHGIFVLKRMNVPDDEAVAELMRIMERYVEYSRELRINEKLEAHRLASECDWFFFSNHYVRAHSIALDALAKRAGGR